MTPFEHWFNSVNWTVVVVCAALVFLGTNFLYALALPRYLAMAIIAPIILVRGAWLRMTGRRRQDEDPWT